MLGWASYEGSQAILHCRSLCEKPYDPESPLEYFVSGGLTTLTNDKILCADGLPRFRGLTAPLRIWTDDEAEARAAYERACEWVRTGVLPDA